jgi:hypothetical protein
LGNTLGITLKDVGKAQTFFLKAINDTKKDIMGAINVNVLVGEN